MSEETSKSTTSTSKFTVRDLTWVLIGLIAGILVGWGIFTATLASSVDKISNSAAEVITSTVTSDNTADTDTEEALETAETTETVEAAE